MCTKCGGYANSAQKTQNAVHRIGKCCQKALRCLRDGRSPEKPHGVIAPFGTQPGRAWNIKPPAANDIVEISESDDEAVERRNWDAAEQRATAADLIGSLLARIDDAAGSVGSSSDSSGDAGDNSADALISPGHDDRTAWVVTARAH